MVAKQLIIEQIEREWKLEHDPAVKLDLRNAAILVKRAMVRSEAIKKKLKRKDELVAKQRSEAINSELRVIEEKRSKLYKGSAVKAK